ncbi:MAG TPA: hypothetical protein VMY37_08265 [Thermoguttaceae bacterium]|nr:hypothetical protein [Thermoguttaceae bacterium]
MASVGSVLLCTLLFSAPAPAEDSVDLPLGWEVGQRLQYEIVKSSRKTRGDQVAAKPTTRTDLEIEVLRADSDGYLIAWTQGETRFDDPQMAAQPMVQRMANITRGLRVLLEIDSEANVAGVENWQELKETVGKFIATISDELKISGIDPGMLSKITAQLASMYATREQIEMMCTREPRMFFLVLGGSFSASEPSEYQDRLPNPFGGEPFPSRAAFVLKEVDRQSQRATIAWTQTLDPQHARRIMEKSLKDLAARVGGPVPQGDVLESMMVEDTAEFVVDLSSGWLDRLSHKRLVSTGTVTQEDVLAIARKPADSR